MNDVIAIGDEVRMSDGTLGTITWKGNFAGIYTLDVSGRTVTAMRFEFQPVKWEGDTLGNTGIGVCAKNGSEEAHG